MECQLRSMADTRVIEEAAMVPEGKVEQVCREWLIREDGVLAYKLQSEEIEQHYDQNRCKNRMVRTDLEEARTVQRSEEEDAEFLQKTYEEMLKEMEREDAKVAQHLHDKLLQEEKEQQKYIEIEDEQLARQLQEKEKTRFERKRRERELERELRQVEKARAHQTAVARSNGEEESLSQAFNDVSLMTASIAAPVSQNHSDFSDFCLQPPPGLSSEDLIRFQEEQDAELARLLQEQETKRRGQNYQDHQIAIEAQDRELARLLQEQERAKAKKIREKARRRALLQQQQQQQDMETIEEAHYSIPSSLDDDRSSRSNLDSRLLRDIDGYSDDEGPSVSRLPGQRMKNIAMVIDPTYNRRKAALESQSSPQVSQPNSPGPSPERSACHSTGDSPINTGINNGFCESGEEDVEGAVPPYMPIQGQRRTSSLDKKKKPKKQKDGCKTQ